MFFNAMRRKGWVPREDDMPRRVTVFVTFQERVLTRLLINMRISVVAIHNAVNERTWSEVRAWEALHRHVLCVASRTLCELRADLSAVA